MAKSKKKVNSKKSKKNVVRKTTVKTNNTKKQEKSEMTKEEMTSKFVKDFCVLVGVLLLVFGFVYLATVGAKKIGWFDTRYNKTAPQEAELNFEYIQAGTMFNRSENKYYVVIGDYSTDSEYIKTLISNYSSKEDALKVYKVDLSEGLNASLKGEEAKTTSSYVSELSINDFTLIVVENTKNVASYVGEEAIAEILK